mgnify:CR=1 FL=1
MRFEATAPCCIWSETDRSRRRRRRTLLLPATKWRVGPVASICFGNVFQNGHVLQASSLGMCGRTAICERSVVQRVSRIEAGYNSSCCVWFRDIHKRTDCDSATMERSGPTSSCNLAQFIPIHIRQLLTCAPSMVKSSILQIAL